MKDVMIGRRPMLGAALAGSTLAALPRPLRAAGNAVKLGVLTDMSGPYREVGGMMSVHCARQAVQDFGDHGITAEIVFADHQNKPDLGASIVRRWYDRDGVDIILDVPTSSVALAVNSVTREKNKVFVACGSGTTDLTGAQCSPNTAHWSYDTYMLARSTGGATAQAGGRDWFFITADYVFGQQLQRDTARFVQQAGGIVLGNAPYPFPGTTDFSSYLLAAQASKPTILGLANAGADTVNCIKQAHEFGLTKQLHIAALLMILNDVHGLGLETAQGLRLTESFYWDLNDRTRAFSARLAPRAPAQKPNMGQAGVYSAALHYLRAVAALGSAQDGAAIMARMKAMPINDDAFGHATLRQDGRTLFPAYLFEVKSPAESHGPWDLYKLIATTPADQAWRPLSEGHCALVQQ